MPIAHRSLAVAVSALGLLVLLASGCQWVRWNLKLKQESPDQRSDLRVYLGLQPLLLTRKERAKIELHSERGREVLHDGFRPSGIVNECYLRFIHVSWRQASDQVAVLACCTAEGRDVYAGYDLVSKADLPVDRVKDLLRPSLAREYDLQPSVDPFDWACNKEGWLAFKQRLEK